MVTGFNNMGMILHPTPTICNAGRIESTGGRFQYYQEGITPAVAQLLERLDEERVRVAAAFGVKALTVTEWLAAAYGVRDKNLWDALQHTPAYAGIMAPTDLSTRYLYEDVATGLVPLASLAQLAGEPVPLTEAIITLASALTGTDFARYGRTLEAMGLAGRTVEEIRQLVL